VEGSSADGDDSALSSMESNDTYGSMVALFFYEARKQGMATALKGGRHQESMPRFGFQGQLKQPMGNRKVGAPMVLKGDMVQIMESGSPACYHTTVPQRARSFQDALEMFHLTEQTGDSALSLRNVILISLYPELDDKEYENRLLGMEDDRDVDHILKTYRVTCKGIQGVRVNLTKAHVHSSERLSSSYCTLRCRFSLCRVNRWSSAITEVPRDPRARIKESYPRDRIDRAIKGIQTMKQSQRDINSYLRVSDTSSHQAT
jgi:hypothetical protein